MVTTMVMKESKTPRQSYVFIKGDFTRHGAPVSANTPAILPPLRCEPGKRPDRLDLARWLVSPDNPLVARVAVLEFVSAPSKSGNAQSRMCLTIP